MTKILKIFLIFVLSFAALLPLSAQKVRYTISPINAEGVLKEDNVRAQVEYLCNPSLGGRATGSEGGAAAAAWLSSQFQSLGLQPLGGAYMHGFRLSSGMARNVMGLIPGSSSRLVIVMAHFDNIGLLNGSFYPGADSNASGVAALLQLGRMFKRMQECRKTYGASLLLVALDAKEKDLSGSAELWRDLSGGKLVNPVSGTAFSPSDISLVVNLDQLGSTLAPLTPDHPEYLMMLSEPSTGRRSTLSQVNGTQRIGLELAFDYYGSKDFTALFYRRVCDQRIFLENGIPAVMFTSGITFNNNKPADTPDSLDFSVLCKRIRLIFYYLDKVL